MTQCLQQLLPVEHRVGVSVAYDKEAHGLAGFDENSSTNCQRQPSTPLTIHDNAQP
jgi:hypothetical protein